MGWWYVTKVLSLSDCKSGRYNVLDGEVWRGQTERIIGEKVENMKYLCIPFLSPCRIGGLPFRVLWGWNFHS